MEDKIKQVRKYYPKKIEQREKKAFVVSEDVHLLKYCVNLCKQKTHSQNLGSIFSSNLAPPPYNGVNLK